MEAFSPSYILQSYCLKQQLVKAGIRTHSWLSKHTYIPAFTAAPGCHTPLVQLFSKNNATAQWIGRSYLWRSRDQKLHSSITTEVTSSPTPPPCGDCAMGRETKHCSQTHSVEQRRSVAGREKNRMMRGGKKKQPSHKCTTISREKQNMQRSKQTAKQKAKELFFLLFLPAIASLICFV